MASFNPSPATFYSADLSKLLKHGGDCRPWSITSVYQDTIGTISKSKLVLSGVHYVSSASRTEGSLEVRSSVDRSHDLSVKINIKGVDHDLRVKFR
jgi:hypothetical protein